MATEHRYIGYLQFRFPGGNSFIKFLKIILQNKKKHKSRQVQNILVGTLDRQVREGRKKLIYRPKTLSGLFGW